MYCSGRSEGGKGLGFSFSYQGVSTFFSAQVEEGWWSGSLNGKSGLFPSNFVKELEASGEDGEPTDTVADETGGKDARCSVRHLFFVS